MNTAEQYVQDVLSGKQIACKWVKLACERHLEDKKEGSKRGIYLDEKAGQKAIDFFSFLSHYKGHMAGQPFKLEPFQQFIVYSIFGWKKNSGYRRFKEAYVEISKKNGKALCLNTPIPTPNGWKTMGDLAVGDHVFDENGKPCRVSFTTEVMHGRECFEVVFSDGCKIIADAEHQWQTQQYRTGRVCRGALKGLKKSSYSFLPKEQVFTTLEIKNTLTFLQGEKKASVFNHRIKNTQPVEYPEAQLPIHPYLLGLWLGDGDTNGAQLTMSAQDAPFLINRLQSINTPLTGPYIDKRNGVMRYRLTDGDRTQAARNCCMQVKLRQIGVLGNKHIPSEYLQASIEQRIELLRGLMDSDGYASKDGQCEFTTTLQQMERDFKELARGLGFKPSTKVGDSKLKGRITGLKYRVQFFAFSEFSCFSLPRKVERLKASREKDRRSQFRQIVAVNPVPSVPVRCIQVDSPTHLYLAGEGFIPTHNTLMAGGIGQYMMVADGEQGAEIYSIATTRDQARICFDDATKMVEKSPALKNRVQVYAHSMFISKTAAKFKPLSSDADSFEGKNPHCAINDEFHLQVNWELYNNTKSAMVARKQPLFFTITTAGYNKQLPCYQLRKTVTEVLKGIKQNDALFGIIFTLDGEDETDESKKDDWKDKRNWIKSNPCLGAALDIEALEEEFINAVNTPSMQVGFLTKNLNIWTDASQTWIDDAKWKLCGRQIDWQEMKGYPCFGGLDLSSKLDITAFVLIFKVENKYRLLPFFWIPEDTARERSKRDGVDYQTWIAQGYITATPGNVIDYAFIKAKILELGSLYQIGSIAYDPWNATQLSIELVEEGVTISEFRQGFGSMSAPTKEFEKLILSGEIEHDNNPVLRWMLSNVEIKRDPAGNIKVDKSKSSEKVDGIVAAIMALGEMMTNPESSRSKYEDEDLIRVGG